MSIELLDEIHAKGLAAAQAHFDSLVTCMHSVLPEGVKDTIPTSLDNVAGLFSASTELFYLTILFDKPGYQSISVVFEHKVSQYPSESHPTGTYWAFKKFSVMIGEGGIFSMPKEYVAMRIEDALVLSKQIAKYREKYAAEATPMPETATTRPN